LVAYSRLNLLKSTHMKLEQLLTKQKNGPLTLLGG
jgi:hypothetical protein